MCAIRDDGRAGIGLVLVFLGVLFFMGGGIWWPLFILLPGLIMLGATFGGRIGAAVFAIPGMIVTGTGALFLAQAVTGYWASWAYVWTLYVAFVGLGIMLMGQRFGDPGLIGSGRLVVKIGMGLFVGFALFFEVIFTLSGLHGSLLPLALIALGGYLLLRDGFGGRFMHLEGGSSAKAKRRLKSKRDDVLFTGPIVYGSRAARSSASVSVGEAEDARPLDEIV